MGLNVTIKRLSALVIAGLVTAVAAAPAAAVVYNWTASFPREHGNDLVSGSGTIVAQNAVTTGFDRRSTGHLVTSITGTYDGAAITGLLPVNSLGGNDNLVDTSQGLVDGDGITFAIAGSDSHYLTGVNVFSVGQFAYTDNSDARLGTFTLTAAVPEPASWALLGAGFGVVGHGLRARRERTVAA